MSSKGEEVKLQHPTRTPQDDKALHEGKMKADTSVETSPKQAVVTTPVKKCNKCESMNRDRTIPWKTDGKEISDEMWKFYRSTQASDDYWDSRYRIFEKQKELMRSSGNMC